MSNPIPFAEAGRLPLPEDNVAIAIRRLEAGTIIERAGNAFALSHTVLEGHRFAVEAIAAGQPLLSWRRSFGKALRDIAPGEYVSNRGMLDALALRHLDFPLPAEANFAEDLQPCVFDPAAWRPVEQVPPVAEPRTFPGYPRPGGRGVGVRNYIVLLGVNARVASFVRRLEERLKPEIAGRENLHGIVAVAHTEGDQPDPNNLDLVLRTLAGYLVHPNAAAVLVVDAGEGEPVRAGTLLPWMQGAGYPLDAVPHEVFHSVDDFEASLEKAIAVVRRWIPEVDAQRRQPAPLGALKVALQCGGSDAFSGISANPLLGWVSRELIRHGGAANIAETDELIGAEAYMIERARSPEVARRFLAIVDRFRQRAAWHGASAEGNPTGGNKFRGLYNINLKSIGAAMKKAPDVRLDAAIEHAERMREPGYYFMDSPGNDLESIAGQVACGCQVIFFSTGNGSITNHPLAPTIKVVTTTPRFELLRRDMDVNAGRYLDGEPMEALGREMFELFVETCAGRRTVGEAAGHAQVQLWRDWRRRGPGPATPASPVRLPGAPLAVRTGGAEPVAVAFPVRRHGRAPAAESVALIMPTSLCAGAIARRAADRLNERLGALGGITRYLALPHTEGCCVSQNAERLYPRTVLGCVTHPSVARCLMLEHGCEVTHNDYMREELSRAGLDPVAFGWASIQLDGGIDRVLERVEAWFRGSLSKTPAPSPATGGAGDLRLAFAASGPVSGAEAAAFADAARTVVAAGGAVVVVEGSGLLAVPEFRDALGLTNPAPTLAYAQPMETPGFHIMASPTRQWTETLVGLAACGVQAVVAHMAARPVNGIPLVPLVRFTADPAVAARHGRDLDFVLEGGAEKAGARLLLETARVLAGSPSAARRLGDEAFQVTRGELALTL